MVLFQTILKKFDKCNNLEIAEKQIYKNVLI